MTRSRQWVFLSLVLVALGGITFAYKVVRLGYPALPDQLGEQWLVQARVEVEPVKGPVRANFDTRTLADIPNNDACCVGIFFSREQNRAALL